VVINQRKAFSQTQTKQTNKHSNSNTDTKMNSPSCVSKVIECVDGMVHSISADESEEDTLRHHLVERWFRERFFLPRPYRSTSLYEADSSIQNDIIDDNSSSNRSMALFSDNLVNREIRSSVVPVSDDEDSCSLHYRGSSPEDAPSLDNYHKSNNSISYVHNKSSSSISYVHGEKDISSKRRSPSGIVVVMDGAPFMPLERNHRDAPDVIMGSKSADESRDRGDDLDGDNQHGLCCEQPSMGFIQRTFSFDEQLPMVYQSGTSMRSLNCSQPILEDDFYVDDQPMITIPVTYPKENNRAKIVYPISVP